jgi:hypothetical protein
MADASVTPRVRCPICVDEFPAPPGGVLYVYNEQTAQSEPVDITRLTPARQAQIMVNGYFKCPHPSGDTHEHYVPATYWYYPDPVIISLIGDSMSGKTMLLASMIREAYSGGLAAYGLQVSILDFRRHEGYRQASLVPFERGQVLPGTHSGVTEPADILLIRAPNGTERVVVFYDVAGEDLASTHALNPSTRHLSAANALIFVHPLEGAPSREGDWSFELATERLQATPGAVGKFPAAIAVTKSDRMRFSSPIDRWLKTGEAPALDAARFRAESSDVYAYLHSRGELGALRPYDAFHRCTLHFVSAAGSEPVEGRFARGIKPSNVLDPLIAILAMTGVLPDAEAEKVGRP